MWDFYGGAGLAFDISEFLTDVDSDLLILSRISPLFFPVGQKPLAWLRIAGLSKTICEDGTKAIDSVDAWAFNRR
jgi:hypothetical protein